MSVTLSIDEFRARDLTWATRSWALLDLRDAGEFADGHIPGATTLPRRMLEFRISEVLPDPSWPIVVYDDGAGDQRAALGAARLVEMGMSDVCVLQDGVAAWVAAGQALATGSNVPCKAFGEEVLHSDPVENVTPEELHGLRAEARSLAICDVRTSGEYTLHHLPGAASYPGFELAVHLPRLMQDHAQVVLNCAGRTRSIIATATARALGFECFAVENGTMGWRLAGYEVESGAAQDLPPPPPEDVDAVTARARDLAIESGVLPLAAGDVADLRATAGQKRPYLVDVRPQDAVMAGHIEGAIWLPGGQAAQRTDDFLAVPGAPVVVIDDGDARAWLAAWWMKRMGFPTVHVLDGGMPAWCAEDRDVTTGRGRVRPAMLDALDGRFPKLGVQALKERLARTPLPRVIDVSTSKSFAKGHLPGAIWISRGWLEARIADHACLDDEIIISASDPAQALLAAEALSKLGYGRVSVFAASLSAWKREGGAVETGAAPGAPNDIVEPPYEQGLQAMRDYLEWEIQLTAGKAVPG